MDGLPVCLPVCLPVYLRPSQITSRQSARALPCLLNSLSTSHDLITLPCVVRVVLSSLLYVQHALWCCGCLSCFHTQPHAPIPSYPPRQPVCCVYFSSGIFSVLADCMQACEQDGYRHGLSRSHSISLTAFLPTRTFPFACNVLP